LKIRESEDEPDKMEYFIHYAGWSKKWEEWVGKYNLLYFGGHLIQLNTYKNPKGLSRKGTPTNDGITYLLLFHILLLVIQVLTCLWNFHPEINIKKK
jgi:RNA binding activity-knot of a chromodomain.